MNKISELKNIIDYKITNSRKVIILPHIYADVDTLSSSLAIFEIAKKYKKEAYIIFNDKLESIDSSARLVIKNLKEHAKLINLKEYNKIKNKDDLYIIVDVNKKDLVCVDNLDKDNTIIIDHHKTDNNTILTDNKYIDISASSASEILFSLLKEFNIDINDIIANFLLAGIYLDTIKFQNVYNPNTMLIVSELMNHGADLRNIKNYFYSDFDGDRKVQKLVSKAEFITKKLAVCIADPDVIYTRAELAKVADYLLKFKIDASFAAGFIDDELISISARSNGVKDVCSIMEELNGGGTIYRAAAKIKSNNINEVAKMLKRTIKKELK